MIHLILVLCLCALVMKATSNADGASSPDNAHVPGVVITHSPASSGQYIGSPGLAVLPDGRYLAKCDLFGPGSTEMTRAVTRVFVSADKGRTWQPRADVHGMYWASIFVHRGAVYLMGTDRHSGNTVIMRSTDAGATWTEPVDENTGLLLPDGGYHCAPVPVVEHRGRLWRGMEDTRGPGSWGSYFHAFMMSVPADADLLRAENWTCTNRIGRDPKWLEGTFGGWLEGNAVVTPEGEVVDMLRVDSPRHEESAAIVRIGADGKRAHFDPEADFVPFPGGAKKFTIRYDIRERCYWSLANEVPAAMRRGKPSAARNTLALIRSTDLRHWEVRAVLLQRPDPEKHGFQYVDWLFEGDDLIAAVRTAYDDGLGGAHNYHDANYLTFHRFADFRHLTGDTTSVSTDRRGRQRN